MKSHFEWTLWYITVLTQEAYKNGYVIKGDKRVSMEFKMRFNSMMEQNRQFANYIKDHNVIDDIDDYGETFGKLFEIFHLQPNAEKKQELFLFLQDWANDKVNVVDDYMTKSQVMSFVKKFTILSDEQLEIAYNKHKES